MMTLATIHYPKMPIEGAKECASFEAEHLRHALQQRYSTMEFYVRESKLIPVLYEVVGKVSATPTLMENIKGFVDGFLASRNLWER